MSEAPAAKRQMASTPDNEAPYKLIYWPGLPGRGEHVRLAFEEASVPYEDTAMHEGAVEKVLAQISTKNLAADSAPNLPPLAPPVLEHGDLSISQTSNILMYLAPRIGLAADSDKDPNAIYRLNALVLTALDGLSNEVHDAHHPICTSLYYEDQVPEAIRSSKQYVKERLPKFFGYFERILQAQEARNPDNKWLYGAQLTVADLVLFQCFDGTAHQFPRAVQQLRDAGQHARLFALVEAVKQRPNIAAYLASERRQKYGEGIYRYYKDLDVVAEDSVEGKE
ncbi:hypothetical protein SEUCBS140593_005862 [Sporothrix eucalyptigena]|uniref:Glutathione S-transferase n=1 Tax=Sporothrix eucalyptigena TaxID=1812306 RepID=A0ABP0BZY2_9PEZI